MRSHSTVSPSPKCTARPDAVLHLRALLAEMERDPALRERLLELLRRVAVLLRDQRSSISTIVTSEPNAGRWTRTRSR